MESDCDIRPVVNGPDFAETRLVHLAHYYPVEEAFEEPLAVDGERYRL